MMDTQKVIKHILDKSENYNVILKSHLLLNSGVNCLIFASYCPSDLFYRRFFKVAPPAFRVAYNTGRLNSYAKRLLRQCGYKRVWAKGIFSIYGDLRPIAKQAGFGDYGDHGIIVNEQWGSNMIFTAVFFK